MPLYLTEADVEALGDMELALEAVEGAFDRQGRGVAGNVGRRRARVPAGALQLMGAADQELGAAGAKIYSSFGGGSTRFVVVLFDVATGLLRAVLEAGRLGELRTGAASGVSSKYLARSDSRVVGLIGSGRQARTQLEALSRVHDLAEARVYSRNPANVEAYVKTMRSRVDADLVACASAAEAVRGADIVVTATSAAGPVLLADNLAPGTHVVAMGSNNPAHGELEPAAVARIDRVFVDDLDGAHEEAGDLIAAARAGVFQWGQAIEFGRVVAGQVAGRTADEEITLFASQGIALWDIALAQAVVERAEAAGRGRQVP